MDLRFPNARLLVQSLIADRKLSVEDAIKAAASQLRLIQPPPSSIEHAASSDDDSHHIPAGDGSNGHHEMCQCMTAAKDILEEYFTYRSKTREISTDPAQVWEALNHDLQSYERAHTKGNRHNCVGFAPVVLDLLLQQARRYD